MLTQRKKVLFVITTLDAGGAEMSLCKVVSGFKNNNQYAIKVVSLTDIGPLGQDLKMSGVDVDSLNMVPGRLSLPAVLKLWWIMIRYKPDVVSTWLYHADFLGGIVARMCGVRAVVWGVRSSDVYSDKTKKLTHGIIKLCSYLSSFIPTRIVSCSIFAVETHAAVGYKKIKFMVVPNGFDLIKYQPSAEMFRAVREELGLSETCRLVGFVGRNHPIKNPEGFLAVASYIAEYDENIHFLMVGKGNDTENMDLIALIQQYQLSNRIHLVGLQRDIPRYMAALDILVLTSWSEGFPTVIGEAMSSGVPCVVTDVGDAAYIVGEHGRVSVAGDMNGLAMQAVELLKMNTDEFALLRQLVRRRIAENFSLDNMVQGFETVFNEAYEQRKSIFDRMEK
ncbi:glycosyltransferase [Aquitalea sp. ASV15]|uniref:glycosyltransferase family 4 protein n=1 Tax=Aquitalea sp. ASV15 TaxID=2795104 RepID=UPI0018ECDAE1|nr:glycosyltransferase [Aquitalea sp. ASV15]